MKLSEFLLSGRIICKKGKLKIDVSLNNGEARKAGDVVSILKENGNGEYHAEDNDWACNLKQDEFDFVEA